ncbi:MAG TPA: response regulator, partial [Blastocatellia bacterium]|nr:response regulator [Blastocatellia bacterium]
MKEPFKILLVDDEPQITRVLRRGLMAQGYEVLTANDGDEALTLFIQWKPHLVVTDLSMPNLDGLQLCRKIRETSAVPIIVLSV